MDFITIIALIVASMLKYSAPLIFTSIGGTFSERGGIVNVGLEGIMVIGAFAGVLFNLTFAESFGNATPWIAAIVAGLVGVLYSLLHAVATINFRADHVVSGTVLNLIAPSLAVFLTVLSMVLVKHLLSVITLKLYHSQSCIISLSWVKFSSLTFPW